MSGARRDLPVGLVVLVLASAGVAVTGPKVAVAAESMPPVIVSVNGVDVYPSTPRDSRPQTFSATVERATLTNGITAYWGPAGDEKLHSVEIFANEGHPLHTGVFTAMSTGSPRSEPIDVEGDLNMAAGGEIDVLDLAATPDGRITRFNILLSSPGGGGRFGQIRMGVPDQGSLSPTAEALQWPLVGRQAPTFPVIDTFRNTTSEPLTVGKARIHGGASRDFTVVADACAGKVLAPGADCTVTTRFKPRQGGPRISTLIVPTSRDDLRVQLSGSAPLGRSKVVIDGGNPSMVTPLTGVFSPLTGYEWGGMSAAEPTASYRFALDETSRQARSNPIWQRMGMEINTKTGRIPRGTWATNDPESPYEFGLTARNDGCNEMYGTMTIRRFEVDAHKQPTYADATFDQRCLGNGTEGRVKASLAFQVRRDTSAPDRPSSLKVHGRKVTWKKSKKKDLQTTIVRAHPGTWASPTGGLLVAVGSSTSATLPRTPAGTTWTVSAFSVDKTGNVSKPRQITIRS